MHASPKSGFELISRWVFVAMAAAAGFFLFTEHGAHLYGWLPYLLLAVCPLMHKFHHHGRHHGDGGENMERREAQQ